MSLLIPFASIPGCVTSTDVQDLWSHPLSHKKWADVVQSIKFLLPPAALVLSGANAPVHTQRNIAIVTLGSPTSVCSPTLQRWSDTFFEEMGVRTMAIDVPEGHRWKVHALLQECQLPALCALDAPKPSLGSSKADPRSVIHLHFDNALQDILAKEGVLQWVRRQMLPFQALVGWTSLTSEQDSMLLEVPCASAGQAHAHLCREMLAISPKLLLVRTLEDAEVWQASLTKSWRQDPNKSGVRLRFRANREGSTFAQAEATPAQITAARARKGHASLDISPSNPKTLQATIHMPINTTGPLESWIQSLLAKFASENHVALKRSTLSEGLGVREWKPLFDAEGKWMYKVLVQLGDEHELRLLHRSLQGKRMALGGHEGLLEVTSDYVDLDNKWRQPL